MSVLAFSLQWQWFAERDRREISCDSSPSLVLHIWVCPRLLLIAQRKVIWFQRSWLHFLPLKTSVPCTYCWADLPNTFKVCSARTPVVSDLVAIWQYLVGVVGKRKYWLSPWKNSPTQSWTPTAHLQEYIYIYVYAHVCVYIYYYIYNIKTKQTTVEIFEIFDLEMVCGGGRSGYKLSLLFSPCRCYYSSRGALSFPLCRASRCIAGIPWCWASWDEWFGQDGWLEPCSPPWNVQMLYLCTKTQINLMGKKKKEIK